MPDLHQFAAVCAGNWSTAEMGLRRTSFESARRLLVNRRFLTNPRQFRTTPTLTRRTNNFHLGSQACIHPRLSLLQSSSTTRFIGLIKQSRKPPEQYRATYIGEETWENASTGLTSNLYYWESLGALQILIQHPAHLEAKAAQSNWLDGYKVITSQVIRTYGDGALSHLLGSQAAN